MTRKYEVRLGARQLLSLKLDVECNAKLLYGSKRSTSFRYELQYGDNIVRNFLCFLAFGVPFQRAEYVVIYTYQGEDNATDRGSRQYSLIANEAGNPRTHVSKGWKGMTRKLLPAMLVGSDRSTQDLKHLKFYFKVSLEKNSPWCSC